MCGLVACVAGRADGEAVGRALAAIAHRGPDGRTTWISADGRVALAHARLAIVDRAGGVQPVASEDGAVRAVVTGEFYGHAEARAALERRGHRFATGSDSELLVHLWEERGEACVEHLRGEFAFVLHDARRRVVCAARDRFGVRPLVWAEADGALWLASEAKALFAAGVEAAWDADAFFSAASLQYLPVDRTLFAGVRQLPPGHLLIRRDGVTRVRRWFDLDYPTEAARGPAPHPEAAVEAVREALDEAVRVRLRPDGEVAFQLSGGVDSSVVVGLAARSGVRPRCFTLAFDAWDELPVAAETCARLGATLEPVRATREALLAALPEAIAQGEGLVINAHAAAKWLLARAVRRAGIDVVLTGEGADEVFAGYAHLRRDLYAGDVAALERLERDNLASAGTMWPDGDGLDTGAVARALGFVPGFLAAKATLGRRLHGLLDADVAARFSGRDAYAEILAGFDVGGQLRGRHPVEQSLYLWSKLCLAGYILRTLGDGMELAHAVEGRLPLLDHRLFAVARALPVSLKIRDGVEKWVLREAARPFVTETVRARPKHPLLAPPVVRADDPLVQDTLRSAALPFFDRARVAALLDALPGLPERARVATEPVLMTVLSACIIARRYGLS